MTGKKVETQDRKKPVEGIPDPPNTYRNKDGGKGENQRDQDADLRIKKAFRQKDRGELK